MDRIPEFLQRHPCWSALLLGLISATGFQPLHLWPAGLAAMAAFVWLAYQQDSGKRAFLLGWLFGVAHFTLTNNWIATAFTYQAEMPAALGWAAVPLLSLYLAVWPALAVLAAWLLGRGRGLVVFALLLGSFWIAAEWLRSWVFTGYAWGPFSQMMLGDWERPGVAGLLPFMGSYALSGLVVTLAGIFALLASTRRWKGLAATIVIVTAGMFWPAPEAEDGFLPLTLVQPNLRQEELDDPSKYEEQFQRIAAPLDLAEADKMGCDRQPIHVQRTVFVTVEDSRSSFEIPRESVGIGQMDHAVYLDRRVAGHSFEYLDAAGEIALTDVGPALDQLREHRVQLLVRVLGQPQRTIVILVAQRLGQQRQRDELVAALERLQAASHVQAAVKAACDHVHHHRRVQQRRVFGRDADGVVIVPRRRQVIVAQVGLAAGQIGTGQPLCAGRRGGRHDRQRQRRGL